MPPQEIPPGSIVSWPYTDRLQLGLVEAVYPDGNLRVRPLAKPARPLAKPAHEVRLLWTLEQMTTSAGG